MSQALTNATLKPCHQKVAYKTAKDALEANWYYKQHQFAVFKCPHCRKHHITFLK